jgi:hypothetical protein
MTIATATHFLLSGRRSRRALCLALLGVGFSGVASAEDRIGVTAIAVNDVARIDKAAPGPIAAGDAVFRDETVRTGAAGSAKFVFADDTNLALGATSTVVLDRFVFDDSATYSKAAVNLAKGAFRFTSGHSPKDAYEIKTGNATIGVRGTILDIRVQGGRSTVTLVEGAAIVCPREKVSGDPRKLDPNERKKRHCVDLDQPGDTATVTSKSASRSAEPFSFADAACGADGDLCGKTGYTGQRRSDEGGFPDGALCGR